MNCVVASSTSHFAPSSSLTFQYVCLCSVADNSHVVISGRCRPYMWNQSDQAILPIWLHCIAVCAQYGGIPTTHDKSNPAAFSKKFPPTLEPADGQTGPSEDAIAAISSKGQPIPEKKVLTVRMQEQTEIMNVKIIVTNAKRVLITSYDSQDQQIAQEDVSTLS